MGAQGHSPARGQGGFGAFHGASGPAGPGGPGGPGTPSTPAGGASGGRRRLLLIGGGVTALLLVAGIGGVAMFSGSDAPPENTTSIYTTDFAADPEWSGSFPFESGDPRSNNLGYWSEQNAMVLLLDSHLFPFWDGVAPFERETPDHVLVSSSMVPLEGPGEAFLGVRCWDQEDEERTMYEALLRFDGNEAQIRRVTEESGNSALAETTEVEGFRTPDLFDEESEVEGLPYGADLGDLVANTLTFGCEYVAEEDEEPSMHLRLWINDELVLSATDDQPLPDSTRLDDEDRRRVGTVVRPAAGNAQISAAFTDFALHRVDTQG
ncbi:hypothetical protein [Nocardiopsis sp. MG754419]|uniref:hypothetical protein n=1 Tax=Nocardiopsis sp. MG754419 TaxID=2259865 RepID=UPI001BAC68BA|nr:hypothetical protein [Nocardiopsis sp. MG754419]